MVVNYRNYIMTEWTYEGGGCIGLLGGAGADSIMGRVGKGEAEEEEEEEEEQEEQEEE